MEVTHLKLTNSRFCILCVRVNYFEADLMVSSRGVDRASKSTGARLPEKDNGRQKKQKNT